MKVLVVLAALSIAELALMSPAHADGPMTLDCTAPTQNTDGSALRANQLPLTFKFYEGTVSGNYPNSSPAQTTCHYVFTGLATGTHFAVATAIDKLGAESARTNAVSKAVPPSTPNPPSMLTVAADLVAYQLIPSDDRLAFIPGGTVAAGTMCDGTQPVVDKFVVPRAAVTWTAKGKKPRVIYASCG